MNIAYVCADHGIPLFAEKGASTHIHEMVRAFNDLGHDIHLAVARLGTCTTQLPADIIRITAEADRVPALGEPDAAYQRQHKEDRYLAIGDAIERHLVHRHHQCPIDLIYERYSLWSAAAVRAARKIAVPTIIEVNAPLVLEQARYRKLQRVEIAQGIEREQFLGAGALVAVSEEVASYAVSRGADPARTHVVTNGVDVERFSTCTSPLLPRLKHERFVIGFVGSLKQWHGIDILLEAFRKLHQALPHCHLLVVGDGPMREYLNGFVNGAKLNDAVTFTGWLPHHDLPRALKTMHVATAPYPALEDFYFSPLKLFEYMAAGVAIVASRIGQVQSVLQHGKTGLLSKPGDVDELCRALRQLHDDKHVRQAMARRVSELAKGHTWRHAAEDVLTLAQDIGVAA